MEKNKLYSGPYRKPAKCLFCCRSYSPNDIAALGTPSEFPALLLSEPRLIEHVKNIDMSCLLFADVKAEPARLVTRVRVRSVHRTGPRNISDSVLAIILRASFTGVAPYSRHRYPTISIYIAAV